MSLKTPLFLAHETKLNKVSKTQASKSARDELGVKTLNIAADGFELRAHNTHDLVFEQHGNRHDNHEQQDVFCCALARLIAKYIFECIFYVFHRVPPRLSYRLKQNTT
jgi:hypothetical protein